MLTPREKSPLLEKFSSMKDQTNDAASSRTVCPTYYQLSYSAPHKRFNSSLLLATYFLLCFSAFGCSVSIIFLLYKPIHIFFHYPLDPARLPTSTITQSRNVTPWMVAQPSHMQIFHHCGDSKTCSQEMKKKTCCICDLKLLAFLLNHFYMTLTFEWSLSDK